MAITLNLENREDKKGRQLLTCGKTPCVILSVGTSESFQVDSVELRKALVSMAGKVLPITLIVDGKEKVCYVKDVQKNALGDQILHVDFYGVEKGRKLVLQVPIVVTGDAKGVKAGGKLKKRAYDLKVEADTTEFPESVNINVSNLELGDKIKVKDIQLANARILDVAERAIVAVTGK